MGGRHIIAAFWIAQAAWFCNEILAHRLFEAMYTSNGSGFGILIGYIVSVVVDVVVIGLVLDGIHDQPDRSHPNVIGMWKSVVLLAVIIALFSAEVLLPIIVYWSGSIVPVAVVVVAIFVSYVGICVACDVELEIAKDKKFKAGREATDKIVEKGK